MLAVFAVTLIMTGFDIISALIVLFMVALIVINVVGMTWMWSISLNAVSLVNLVVCIGIGVEFISHIVLYSDRWNRPERSAHGLTNTGSNGLSGISLTKFAGIVVLAFARSQVISPFISHSSPAMRKTLSKKRMA